MSAAPPSVPTDRPTPAAPPASPRASIVFFVLAVAAGCVLPVQGRVNAALAQAAGDPVLAALCSFTLGLVVMVVVSALTRSGRRGLAAVRPALAARTVRPWYFLAGAIGGVLVLAQALTIGTIGVAVFTVSVVTGQVVGGMLVDRLGLSPAGVRHLTPRRLIGAGLALVAVLVVVWPQLGGADVGPLWLLFAALPLLAGLATAEQQVLNARQATAYGSALPATLTNFAAGTVALGLVWVALSVLAGSGPPNLPSDWRLYISGPLGCLFIGFSAVAVPRIGVFATTLGLVSGNLVGSLVVDLVAPTAGSHVTAMTVVGTLGALAAVTLASMPTRRPAEAAPVSRR